MAPCCNAPDHGHAHTQATGAKSSGLTKPMHRRRCRLKGHMAVPDDQTDPDTVLHAPSQGRTIPGQPGPPHQGNPRQRKRGLASVPSGTCHHQREAVPANDPAPSNQACQDGTDKKSRPPRMPVAGTRRSLQVTYARTQSRTPSGAVGNFIARTCSTAPATPAPVRRSGQASRRTAWLPSGRDRRARETV